MKWGIGVNSIQIHCRINDQTMSFMVDPNKRVLDVLREDLHLTGTKEGCGVGECGACTIVVDGLAVNACLMTAAQMDGAEIRTVEGLEKKEIGKRLQRSFAENCAVQCGFCTPGMLMSAYALLLENPHPGEEDIRTAISGNICRCTGYDPIVTAVKCAAEEHGSIG